MNTKINHAIGWLLLITVTGGGIFFAGCSKSGDGSKSQEQKTLYTCGMHPQVIQDHPGNCPICGMKLTPIRKQAGASATSGERKIKYYKSTMIPGEVKPEPGKDSMGMDMVPVYEDEATSTASQTIAIDPVTIQNMAIRTALVQRGPLRRVIRTVGTIDYNETALADVNTKVKGWIEKLYVDTTGQQVQRGDPLFEIFSPELYSAQTEYVLALGSATNETFGAATLRESALTKLKFFDISDAQIAELEQNRQPKKSLRILAPIDGFVTEKMVVAGQMVDAGMKLYRIADLSLVWVQAQVYEQDLPFVKLGQEADVSLSYLPDRKFRGRVTYIYPTVDEKTRTAKVRMEFHNPGYFLKPGMFAAVELASEISPSVLLVPDMAVLRSGTKNTVFVALEGGKFEPRTVTLGARGENDVYQVFSGLKEGDRVVTSGQFMLDSESQLREAIQKMLKPTQPTSESQGVAGSRLAIHRSPLPGAGVEKSAGGEVIIPSPLYTCPMASHADVVSDKPGDCPKCEMTLVETSTVNHGKIAEQNWRKRQAGLKTPTQPQGQIHEH